MVLAQKLGHNLLHKGGKKGGGGEERRAGRKRSAHGKVAIMNVVRLPR